MEVQSGHWRNVRMPQHQLFWGANASETQGEAGHLGRRWACNARAQQSQTSGQSILLAHFLDMEEGIKAHSKKFRAGVSCPWTLRSPQSPDSTGPSGQLNGQPEHFSIGWRASKLESWIAVSSVLLFSLLSFFIYIFLRQSNFAKLMDRRGLASLDLRYIVFKELTVNQMIRFKLPG